MTQYYENYIADVINSVAKDRLLIYKVQQGWEPLCSFLNVPVPDIPFPHVNSRDDHARMMSAMKTASTGNTSIENIGSVATDMFEDKKD